MKNIISELFYGNIDPQTRSYQKGSYIQKYMTILANAEEVLTKSLSGDDKKTFLSYANASNIVLGESELDSFLLLAFVWVHQTLLTIPLLATQLPLLIS